MRDVFDYDSPCGYVVTCRGLSALLEASPCECPDILVVNGVNQCQDCGTVWGVVYGFSKLVPLRRSRQRGLRS